MFSQTVEYALRAVVHLAHHEPQPQTTRDIARATKVPPAYLSKVLQSLARGGVVASQRGIGGGVRLVKSPTQISVLEVVNAVEPIRRIHTCPLGLAAHGEQLCPLHSRMDQAISKVEVAFRRSTVAEILAEPSSSVPLCEFPQQAPIKKPVKRRPAPAQAARPAPAQAAQSAARSAGRRR